MEQQGYAWKSIAQTKTQTLQEFFPDYNPTFQTCSDEEAIRDMLKKVFDENKKLKEKCDFACPLVEKLIEEKETLTEERNNARKLVVERVKSLKKEIKALKDEVIAERKKVIEAEDDKRFVGEMWMAESRFLHMPSATNQPEEFNEFLKHEFNEEMYEKLYEAFELEELLEESDEDESDEEA